MPRAVMLAMVTTGSNRVPPSMKTPAAAEPITAVSWRTCRLRAGAHVKNFAGSDRGRAIFPLPGN